MCVRERESVSVCVCVCEREREEVSVCVCKRETQREYVCERGYILITPIYIWFQALNAAGMGPYSPAASCQTPPSSPGTVMSLRWQPGPTSIQLWWRPPACNGSDLVSYNISVSDKQVIAIEPVSEYTLENLQPETTYK